MTTEVSEEPSKVPKPSVHIPQVDNTYVNNFNGYVYTFRTWLYDFMLFILNILFTIFFREIKIRGGQNIPPIGTPTILVCAPHANQFIDPSLIMVATRNYINNNHTTHRNRSRQPCFVTAASSFNVPVIREFGLATGGIPVPRQQDNLKELDQKFKLYAPNYSEKPLILKTDSKDVDFNEIFELKGLIGLPQYLANARIDKIIDSTTLQLSAPLKTTKPENQKRLENALKKGTNFKYAKKVDNSQIFQNVFNHLHSNGCVGIFPEGGSHDRPSLLPLKAGVAVMALGAAAASSCSLKTKISVVPVGLNYFHRDKFRSRAVIEYGKPIIVDHEMGEEYVKDPRNTVSDLLKKITKALYSVTENAPDYETLMTIQAARRLYVPTLNKKKLPLHVICKINRNLLLGYSKFKDDERIVDLKKSVTNYNKQLFLMGLKDHQVDKLKTKTFDVLRTLFVLFERIIKIVIFFTMSLPGYILFTPIFIAAHYYSLKKQRDGLKKSVVKIKGTDLLATWKLVVALGMAPLLYITYSLILVYLHSIDFKWTSWIMVPTNNLFLQYCYFYALLVLTTYSSLKTGETGMDLLKSLSPLIITIMSPTAKIEQIQKMRKNLSIKITDICNELGPEVIPNFEKYKTVEEDSSSKSTTPSLPRSRSSSIYSQVSHGLSRVNSRASLTDIPIFSEGRFSQTPELSSKGSAVSSSAIESDSEHEKEATKISSLIRERRINRKTD